MSEPQFSHDPTASRTLSAESLYSAAEAKAAFDDDEQDADGIGLVLTRHDQLLVCEFGDAWTDAGVATPVAEILTGLGRTVVERTNDGLRAFYCGSLPEPVRGGEPIVVDLVATETVYPLRLFDSGWVPLTGKRAPNAPKTIQPVDPHALSGLLSEIAH